MIQYGARHILTHTNLPLSLINFAAHQVDVSPQQPHRLPPLHVAAPPRQKLGILSSLK
jgi:hypothetical protein